MERDAVLGGKLYCLIAVKSQREGTHCLKEENYIIFNSNKQTKRTRYMIEGSIGLSAANKTMGRGP